MFWNSDSDAQQFVNNFQDVTSADTYWFTDSNLSDASEGGELLNNGNPLTVAQTRLAANYGYTVDRMRELDAMDGELQPIWAFVEVGWPFTRRRRRGRGLLSRKKSRRRSGTASSPGRAASSISTTASADPEQTQHALRDPDYAAERAAVTETNALIEQLAPVLNSPFDDGFVTVNSSSVRAMAKLLRRRALRIRGQPRSTAPPRLRTPSRWPASPMALP